MRQRLNALAVAVTNPRFDLWLVPAFLAALALARAARFEERDPYWEARAGIENLAGLPLTRPDTWSWSGVQGPWYQNSPLWNTLLGFSFNAAGFWGIFLITAATIGLYLTIVYQLALRLGARRLPALAGILVTIAPALSMLSPRATIVVQIVMLGSVLLAMVAADQWAPRWPPWLMAVSVLLAGAALSTLGNWLHLSFLAFAPMIGGAWAVIWCLSELSWPRRLILIALGLAGWCSGPLLSPYGLALGWERTRVVQQVCDGLILEWTPPFQAGISPVFYLMVAAATIVAAAASASFIVGWRRQPRSAVRSGHLVLLLIGVPAAIVGWFAIRFLGISLLTLAPLAAVLLTDGVDRLRLRQHDRVASRWREYTTGGMWRVVTAGALVVLLPWLAALVSLHAKPDEISAITRLPAGCRLLSSGALASAVILARPDVRVWIDGRADFYGRNHLIKTYEIFAGSEPGLVPPGTQCILIDGESEDSARLAPAVAASPDWRLEARLSQYELWLPSSDRP